MNRRTKMTVSFGVIFLAFVLVTAGPGFTATPENLEAYHLEMPATDEECAGCHSEVLEEVSLSPDVSPPHPIHQEEGLNCTFCHQSVDLVQESAASLRRNDDVGLCAACHTTGDSVWYQGGE